MSARPTSTPAVAFPFRRLIAEILFTVLFAYAAYAQTPPAAAKAIGAIKTISGAVITLTPDTGADISVTVQPASQIVRIAPGEKNLANAAAIQLSDLHVGDRIRVTGQMSDDKSSLIAAKIVAIAHTDLEARHQQEMQDWQKRGVDGLATAVDAASGTITISVRNKTTAIHTSSATAFRRYPPDSVKFDDAKPSTFSEIHAGDQVRARGDRKADSSELTAEEIVFGSFRNVAGTVDSVDASSSTIGVHDLLSKKTLRIKVTADSQLRHLSPEMAQRIAARLKGVASGASAGTSSGASSGSSNGSAAVAQPSTPTERPAGGMGSGTGGFGGRPGAPDFQQMLSRLPVIALSDLHKGDAVVMVATEGDANSGGTVITLLSGVEPIFQAAPGASSSSILTPWSLGAPSGDAGGP